MAEAAAAVVKVVLGKLTDALINKAQELKDVSEQIKQMHKELLLIQALLKDADSRRNRKELVTEWLNQVREIADTIATVIDTFHNKIEENRPESSNWINKKTKVVRRSYKTYKHGLHKELEGITEKLNRILQRGIQLGIQDKLGASDDVDDPEPSDKVHDPEPSDEVDDPEVVGLEDDTGKIIVQLLDGSISRRTVLSIVGTGGLGKTTLVKKVYKSAELEGKFNCRAWLSISQKYNLNDLMREILYSVDPRMKRENPPVTDRDLPVKLKISLREKRYLIVLDDVWHTDLWEQLKAALPDLDNASRVIITTRSLDVANAADYNTKPYKLRYLSDAEGLALLFRSAFQQDVQPENCPSILLKVAKRLTKKCGGLPLALVVLGGILTRKDRNYTAWNTLCETMDWHDKDGKKCSKVLALSYDELPNNLKPCFLYFAGFPEDYKISGDHIKRMWMAEGFIPKDGAGTIEDRAEKFLEELVQRCLIQVTKISWNGYCKYCNMHDLLRDLAITKAKEEKFFTIFSRESEDFNQLATSKPHRAALQFCTLTEDGVYLENTHSLFCFGFDSFFGVHYSSDDCGFSKLNYSGFRLLTVLTLENIDMTKFAQTQWLKGLTQLRHLGLRCCTIVQDIFRKFSFDNLETIDFKGSVMESSKWDFFFLFKSKIIIPNLRYLCGGNFYSPFKWNQHTNLHTVDVLIEKELVGELGCCIHLRTLKIRIAGDIDNARALILWVNLLDVLYKTKKLVYLSICILESSQLVPFSGTRGFPCHEKIQKLCLYGSWGKVIFGLDIFVPTVEMFPINLTKLVLRDSMLEKDPMPVLERLENLRILYLLGGSLGMFCGELTCSTGGFRNLEKLKLQDLYNLHYWKIQEGAMPMLRHLEINNCSKLQALPRLQMVRTLQELLVIELSDELRESMHEDLYKIEHIPSVRITR